jgi:heterotetrameric sarcosine oxidase delta subunit
LSRRPRSRPSPRELNTYNYFRRNVAGVQREWWYHRSGCRAWFYAERDTRTNVVLWTALPGSEPPEVSNAAPGDGMASPGEVEP